MAEPPNRPSRRACGVSTLSMATEPTTSKGMGAGSREQGAGSREAAGDYRRSSMLSASVRMQCGLSRHRRRVSVAPMLGKYEFAGVYWQIWHAAGLC